MIELFTASTPNGWKASIALEELGLDYQVRPIQLEKLEQKEDWFLELNPNGRIPVIKDHGNGGHVVFESGAILVYLAEKAGALIPRHPLLRSQALQWLFFQVGGVGPMMGQANVFYRYTPEKIPYAIERYQRESRRLLEVLERRLSQADYLAEEYSIADIANYCWACTWEWSGIDIDGLDALQDWMARIRARPAVEKGRSVPQRIKLDDEAEREKLQGDGKNLLV